MLVALLASILLGQSACSSITAASPASDPRDARRTFRTYSQPEEPLVGEPQCAWFAEPSDDVLYFGQSAFWAAMRRSGGDPAAVLETPGPRRIGRFDLARERMLEPLDVAHGPLASEGVWDVLPVGGRVYFTTYFDAAGVVDLANGEVTYLEAAGPSLNELAVGPDSQILVTRYADLEGGGGAVLALSVDGAVNEVLPLAAPAGEALAAKSVAWDPVADEIWVTTDRLPLGGTTRGESRPTLVLARDGRERERFGAADDPIEVEFVRFSPAGFGAIAWVRGGRLELVLLPPGKSRRGLRDERAIVLDPAFPELLDFAQDIHIADDGRVVVTRWSGRLHVVSSTGDVTDIDMPESLGGLYYSGVADASRVADASGGMETTALEHTRLCVTRCDAIEIVCTDLAPTDERTR